MDGEELPIAFWKTVSATNGEETPQHKCVLILTSPDQTANVSYFGTSQVIFDFQKGAIMDQNAPGHNWVDLTEQRNTRCSAERWTNGNNKTNCDGVPH